MSLLIVILIVLVIVALAMWAIYYIPLPPGSPTFIKPLLYVLVLVVAIVFLMTKAGMAQTKPVPQLKKTPATTGQIYEQPKQRATAAQGWQRFKGATRCEQIGNVLSCDNGYRQTVR